MIARAGNEAPVTIGATGLFGLYYPAVTAPPQRAVLLCAPLGQDQLRSHRLHRQLALALASAGCAVLRYDCYGSGDSPGASTEVDWQRCIADTVEAANALRQHSGCQAVTAFGARLGGSLALAASAADFDQLLLWDAVLDGTAYVAQLDDWQARLHRDPMRFSQPRSASDAAGQWLGFAVSATLRAQISALRATPAAVPTVLLESSGTLATPARQALLDAGARCLPLAAPSPWEDYARLETIVLAPEMIRAVCAQVQASA